MTSQPLNDADPVPDAPSGVPELLQAALARAVCEGLQRFLESYGGLPQTLCGVLGDSRKRPLLTAQETAEFLSIGIKDLYNLVEANRIPCVRVGRRLRFDERDLSAWLIDPAYRIVPAHVKARRARAA